MGYLGDGDERRSMGLHGQGDQPQSSDGMLCVLSVIDVLKWATMPLKSYVSRRVARKLIWNTGSICLLPLLVFGLHMVISID